MSDTVGLARLPGEISALLRAQAGNVIACAAAFDAQRLGRGAEALESVQERRSESDRLTVELIAAIRRSRRAGPDRARLIDVARALRGTVDSMDAVARWWSQNPIAELAVVLEATRDAARAAARAIEAIEDEEAREGWVQRCLETEAEAAELARRSRRWLLVDQSDPVLAVMGQSVLEQAATWAAAVARLRVTVVRFVLVSR